MDNFGRDIARFIIALMVIAGLLAIGLVVMFTLWIMKP